MVITCRIPRSRPGAQSDLRKLLERAGYVEVYPIGQFKRPKLAYQQFLFQLERLVVNRAVARDEQIETLFAEFDRCVRGVPSRLVAEGELRTLLDYAKKFGLLTEANDEDALAAIRAAGGGNAR
jgi:hypothetical protein